MKKRYSHRLSGMGLDSIFIRLSPWSRNTVKIRCKLPTWWGTESRTAILSAPGRSSITGEVTTKRVVFPLLWLVPRYRISSP